MSSLSRKVCNCCGVEKDYSEYYLRSDNGKPRGDCKPCLYSKTKAYLQENSELARTSRKKHYYKDVEASREYHRSRYHEQDREASTKRKRLWYARNRDKVNTTVAQRRAMKLEATPPWLTEDHLRDIQTEFALASWATQVMGEPYHVDHVVPLKGDTVCGLHVPWNLRVITAKENLSKSNKLLETV